MLTVERLKGAFVGVAITVLIIVLSGCSTMSPLTADNAIGTVVVPNGETDCQIRTTGADVAGSGIAVGGGARTNIHTVIGVDNCLKLQRDPAMDAIRRELDDLRRRLQ